MAMALKAQSQPAQFFVQKLDHFAANDSRSFEQKYYVDDSHYRPPHGPVFLYISGEAPLYGAPSGAGSIIGELAALPTSLNESRSTGAAVTTFRLEDGDGALSALSVLARLASSDIFCAGLEMKPTANDGRLRD